MRRKYKVKKCACVPGCNTWKAIDPTGFETFWYSWSRAMLRATKEY